MKLYFVLVFAILSLIANSSAIPVKLGEGSEESVAQGSPLSPPPEFDDLLYIRRRRSTEPQEVVIPGPKTKLKNNQGTKELSSNKHRRHAHDYKSLIRRAMGY